jgi:preprotein translocase subunit SecG
MTARGAADFLSRSTAILGGLFIVLSIVMAAIAGANRQPAKIDTSLSHVATPLERPQQQQPQSQPQPQQNAPAPTTSAPQNQQAPAVPLAQ